MKMRVMDVVDRSGQLVEKSYWFWCPGCKDAHRINDTWSWDGNLDEPTIDPSILVNGREPRAPGIPRCHSFIRKGQWQFLSDSDHRLAGQTVPMVDLPKWLADEK